MKKEFIKVLLISFLIAIIATSLFLFRIQIGAKFSSMLITAGNILSSINWIYTIVAVIAAGLIAGIFILVKSFKRKPKPQPINNAPANGGAIQPPTPPQNGAGSTDIFEHFDFVAFIVTMVILFILVILSLILGNIFNIKGLGWIAVIGTCFYIYEGLQMVNPGEVAALVFLGKPYKTVWSGPVYAPLGIIKVERDNGRIIQAELPAEPNKIWRGTKEDENAPPPPGFQPPIRILFGPSDPDPTLQSNPYNEQIVAEVPIFISYQVQDMVLWLNNMGSHDKARQNIEDMAIALFNIEFSQKSPAAVNRDLGVYSNKLKTTICENVESWGIDIKVARVKPIIFSHKLNTAVIGVSEAALNSKKTGIDAEATKNKLVKEGEGAGSARKSLLKAEADGLLLSLTSKAEGVEKLRKLIAKPNGLDVLQLEMLVEALKGSNNTIISGAEGIVKSAIAAFQTGINPKKP